MTSEDGSLSVLSSSLPRDSDAVRFMQSATSPSDAAAVPSVAFAVPVAVPGRAAEDRGEGKEEEEANVLDDRTVSVVHIESVIAEPQGGSTPPQYEFVMSIVERDVDKMAPFSPMLTPGTPGANARLIDAQATLMTEELMHDSFLLDLPEKSIESRLVKVRQELGADFEIKECDKAQAIEDLLENEFSSTKQEASAFYLMDLGTVVRKYEQWVHLLPNVKPFYAVKANPLPAMVRTCKAVGTGFDCASQNELEQVLELGVDPENIIFANPCKMKAHILYAKKHNVRKMTFDNEAELQKIHENYPEAELILRLLPPDASSAVCNFGSKFGADKKMTKRLLKQARKLGANVCGVSFHVGSGCWDPNAYTLAMELAYSVCMQAENEYGFKMKIVDIGGGYPAADNLTDSISFPTIAEVLNKSIQKLFPPESGIQIIGEPGRYLCGEAVVLAVSVIAKRTRVPAESTVYSENPDDADDDSDENDDKEKQDDDEEEEQILYYLSDGVYGSFNNVMFDHQNPVPHVTGAAAVAAAASALSSGAKKSTLFGPTCDSIDVICRDVTLPELEVGSWLYFLNMGAYTIAAASSFNGFTPPNCKYIITPG
ncbi:Ornithine decarboxylase [Porphyridium purpureum]|uniref:Ornithine decarboxylase n=1 Tax=Porphyridium purpureum TaxID=35688 RepID=A0A5J4YHE8_PORPP|nr:Ornithine decarboxylase [Porphyridium purpureum]|eukprot:POR0179..scf251_18